MKIKNALLIAALLGAPTTLWAEEAPEAAPAAGDEAGVAAEIDTASVPAAEPVDPGMLLQELIDEWEINGGGAALVARHARNELFYATASAVVQVTPEHRRWVDFRNAAYDEALLKAKAKYIRHIGLSNRSEQLSRLFDNGGQMPAFTPEELASRNKLTEVLNKAVALASGKLDEQLRELGIDPSEFKAAPPQKRTTMFEQSVQKRIETRAHADLNGVIPVKTFEAKDANGNMVVGVAIVASPKFRDEIATITRSRGEVSPEPKRARGTPLRAFLHANRQGLINEFGIRKMYDDQGYPVLISYGQAGNPYQGENYQRKAAQREVAFASARNQAVANFAFLLNSSGSAIDREDTRTGSTTVGTVELEGGVTRASEEHLVEYVRQLESTISTKGRIDDMPGISELYRWSQTHPEFGHEINGVVYMWHPRNELMAREHRNPAPVKPAQAKPAAAKSTGGQAGTAQSMDLMDAADF